MARDAIRRGSISATASLTRLPSGPGTPCSALEMTSPRRISLWSALSGRRPRADSPVMLLPCELGPGGLRRASREGDDGGYGVVHGVHKVVLVAASNCAGADGRFGRWRADRGCLEWRRSGTAGRRPRGSGLAGPRAADRGGWHRETVGRWVPEIGRASC